MTEYLIQGKAPKQRVLAGGEGRWYSDNGCGFVDLPGVNGAQWSVWANATPTITGPGTLTVLVSGYLFRVTGTGSGTIEVTQEACIGGGLFIHEHLVPIIDTTCG